MRESRTGRLILYAIFLQTLRHATCQCGNFASSVSMHAQGGSWHQQMVGEVAAAERTGVDLVIYGDSIMEGFRGSKMGYSGRATSAGAATVAFAQYFGYHSSLILASAGDTAGNLLWRIQHGELLTFRPPKVAVVYVGTNDLTGVDYVCQGNDADITAGANGVVTRIKQIVDAIHGAGPATHIILMGLWPRGEPGEPAWPNRYKGGIDSANLQLQAYAATAPNFKYLYCGGAFATADSLVNLADNVHPSDSGYYSVAACLQPVVDSYLYAAPNA